MDTDSIFPNVLWSRIREAEREAPEDRPIVLVVEDDPSSQILMRYALRDVVRTDAAGTVTDALRMAETIPYDGLLVDLGLPDGSGTQVAEELRTKAPYWGVPMVAVAEEDRQEEDSHFLDVGFDAYVAKPFEQDEVRTLVRHLVVESDQAVDRGRKLVRKEDVQQSSTKEEKREENSAREKKSVREESRREPPATQEIDVRSERNMGSES